MDAVRGRGGGVAPAVRGRGAPRAAVELRQAGQVLEHGVPAALAPSALPRPKVLIACGTGEQVWVKGVTQAMYWKRGGGSGMYLEERRGGLGCT